MSERYNPRKLKREVQSKPFKPEPRDQVVYRDGKPQVLSPLLCRLHNQPWQTCALCSTVKR